MKLCVNCKKSGNHYWRLCPKQFGSTEELSTVSAKVKESNLVAVCDQVIIQTAMVNLVCPMNHDKKCETKTRLLLNCGAQRSSISEELVKKMNLKQISKNLLIVYTFGTTKPRNVELPMRELCILLNNDFTINIKANVLPNVTGSFERKPINNNSIKNILQKYELADTLLSSFEICDDLLIRNIYYPDIVSMKIMTLKDGLYLLGLKLGWILSG